VLLPEHHKKQSRITKVIVNKACGKLPPQTKIQLIIKWWTSILADSFPASPLFWMGKVSAEVFRWELVSQCPHHCDRVSPQRVQTGMGIAIHLTLSW